MSLLKQQYNLTILALVLFSILFSKLLEAAGEALAVAFVVTDKTA